MNTPTMITGLERYSFVAVTTADLAAAREFWVDRLGFAVTEESPGDHFIVDAGGLRLCVDTADGEIHRVGGTDPVIGFKVESVDETLVRLEERGLRPSREPAEGDRGRWAALRDPDGRTVILTEAD
jgi:catechol 2,3-dioxygenase-like lactoylglutathione lyase family enzyme